MNFQLTDVRPQAPLHVQSFHEWSLPDGTLWTSFYRIGADYLLRFPDLADFQVCRNGHMVCCWPVDGISNETIQHLYLNQVLPLALGRQGKLVFHASAVEIGGEAVAFMGESGKGKSTLAASFATSGFRFLTDDGLVLDSRGGGYQIVPSHPSIRLWEDSQDALIVEGAQMAPMAQYTSKARFLAGNDIVFCDQPRNLRRVYILGQGTSNQPVFDRIRPSEVLIELVKHSFLLDTEERKALAAHFDELSILVQGPTFYRLDYPRRFEDLALVRQAIVRHVSEEEFGV